MTRESKDLLLMIIKKELEEEEKCGMLEEHEEYIRDLIKAEKEILQTIYNKHTLMDTLLLGSTVSGDVERFLKREVD